MAATIEELERRRAQLDARIKDLKSREAKAERRARDHALVVMGAMLESRLGGDWRAVDLRALDAALHGCAALDACVGEPRPTADATREVREFQRFKREAGREAAARREAGGLFDALGTPGAEPEYPNLGYSGSRDERGGAGA